MRKLSKHRVDLAEDASLCSIRPACHWRAVTVGMLPKGRILRSKKIVLLSACAFLSAPVCAQAGQVVSASSPVPDQQDNGLTDIVVTAQKRSENLQDVPVSVSVVTANQLEASGITDIRNLKMAVPSVEIQTLTSFALPIIRGVGNRATIAGVEPPNAFYMDGVYYATSTSTMLAFNNISQVEVLKGPQGTLFGRNATGGLIQITTRDPSPDFSGEASVSLGNYETLTSNDYITGGIAPGVNADLAVHMTTMGKGYGTNLFNDKDVYRTNRDLGIRSKWLLELGSETTVRLIGDYADAKNSNNALRFKEGTTLPAPFGPAYGGSPWDIDADVQPLTRLETGGASLRVDHGLGDYNIVSISAYRRTKTTVDFDIDYTRTRGRYVAASFRDWQFSQELQLLSPTGGVIDWVAGLYYFKANSDSRLKSGIEGPAISPVAMVQLVDTRAQQGTESMSGFGQANVQILDGLKGTVGLRYTSEKRLLTDASQVNTLTSGAQVVAVPLTNLSKRFNKLTWRFALDYELSSRAMTYVSYNRGFKSGGFNAGALALPPFDPEVLDAYEIGLKSEVFDRQLRLNVAGFWYDYQDVQVQRTVSGSTGLYNSGKVKQYGAEADLEVMPTDDLSIRIAYQYLYGEYRNFPNAIVTTPLPTGGYAITTGDVTGNETGLTPRSTVSANVSYAIPIGSEDLTLNSSFYYNSGFYNEPDNTTRQPSYSLINASAQYEFENGLSLMVWGNNLTDKAVSTFDGIQNYGATGTNRVGYNAPRTYGITAGFKF